MDSMRVKNHIASIQLYVKKVKKKNIIAMIQLNLYDDITETERDRACIPKRQNNAMSTSYAEISFGWQLPSIPSIHRLKNDYIRCSPLDDPTTSLLSSISPLAVISQDQEEDDAISTSTPIFDARWPQHTQQHPWSISPCIRGVSSSSRFQCNWGGDARMGDRMYDGRRQLLLQSAPNKSTESAN